MLLWSSPLGQWPSSAVLHSGRKVEGEPTECTCGVVSVFKWVRILGHIPRTRGILYWPICLLMSHSTWVWGPPCDWEKRKRENEFPLCPQAHLCLIRSFEGKLITWLCARPQQIHNIFVVPQLSHHFEFRHESFSFRAVCFLCQWKNINVKQEF